MVESVFSTQSKKLKAYYLATGFKMSFQRFLLLLFLSGLFIAAFIVLVFRDPLLSFIGFLSVISLAISVPVTIRSNRIESIELNLPDALKHMALVLKAGGTTENALEEVATAGYGPLSSDLKASLRQLKEGKSFDAVLTEVSENSGSKLFKQTAIIVLDAKRAGAGLADVMFAIAEDARDVMHIKRERKSRTTMHVLFLVASSFLISPFIFGFAISIVNFISTQMAAAQAGPGLIDVVVGEARQALCDLHLLLMLFIVFQSLVGILSIGLIREGRLTKFLAYAPIAILFSLLVFIAGKALSVLIVQGAPITCGLI